jgi:tetratricopeptide (TPR) repeat protein
MLEAWERARSGHRQHVLVRGEAGIGKTRLAEELILRVRRQGGRVLRGRAGEAGAPSYSPWIEAFAACIEELGLERVRDLAGEADPGLARLLPGLRLALSPPDPYDNGAAEASRLRLFDSAALLLRRLATEQPVLMVLDEIEAADLPSLELLRFVVRARTPGAVMMLATCQTPLPPGAPRATVLASVAREPGVTAIDLGGLAIDELCVLVQLMTGEPISVAVARALQERTGGNPLHVSQLVRLVTASGEGDLAAALATAPLPDEARALGARRLSSLPAACRRLMEAAAVVGREVELVTLAAVTGEEPQVALDTLGPALVAGVLVPVPDRPLHYAFAHGLIREAIHADLGTRERARLHHLVANALCARYAPMLDDHLDTIARHYVAAIPFAGGSLARRYCRLAARRATRLGAHDEAVRLLSLVVEAARLEGPGRSLHEALLELGEAQTHAGHNDEARGCFLAVAEDAQRDGNAAALARAAMGLSGCFRWSRASPRFPEARLADRALALLPERATALRARLLARLAAGDHDHAARAHSLAAQAVELARASEDDGALGEALLVRATLELGLASRRVLGTLDELQAISPAASDLAHALEARAQRVAALLNLGETAAAERELAATLQLAERAAPTAQRWLLSGLQGQLALLRGDLERAEGHARESQGLGRSLHAGESTVCALVQLHAIRREQRRLGELTGALDQAVVALPFHGMLSLLRVHLDLELGYHQPARTYLDRQLSGGFADLEDTVHHRYMVALCVELAERLGHRSAAAALQRMLVDVADPCITAPMCLYAGSTERFRGLCAATLGDTAEALARLREAVRIDRAAGAPLCLARSELTLARVLLSVAANHRGPAEPAAGLLAEVERAALRLGSEDLLLGARQAALAPPATAPHAGPTAAEFRRQGELWVIRFAGRALQVRGTKGIRYLAELLGRPGQDLAALELVAGGLEPAPRTFGGDLGPMLDATARATFKRRLAALDEEIEQAGRRGDEVHVARARREHAALTRELAAAVGLGGRARPTGDVAERARQSVTKAIKTGIRRIAREHPALGQHLDLAVHTGVFCTYQPETGEGPVWRVEL